ncbi:MULTISPECIES: hypothetical protein [Microbacterium]|uniref:hypothetical protein n=1 Tax=Microbacterium TaxID=33882 RepID=UPI001D1715AD|nr:hypothetical protein [Microbacterium testaceum]MCC4248038.1 hypothetical protein [Microbacterium testaceum]
MLDVVSLVAILALFALVALVARGVENLGPAGSPARGTQPPAAAQDPTPGSDAA